MSDRVTKKKPREKTIKYAPVERFTIQGHGEDKAKLADDRFETCGIDLPLAWSILELGNFDPIAVKKSGAKLLVVYGRRRLRHIKWVNEKTAAVKADHEAGLPASLVCEKHGVSAEIYQLMIRMKFKQHQVKYEVQQGSYEQLRLMQIHENAHRKPLSPAETSKLAAEVYYNHQEAPDALAIVARHFGVSEPQARNLLKLNDAPDEVLAALDNKDITQSEALRLRDADDAEVATALERKKATGTIAPKRARMLNRGKIAEIEAAMEYANTLDPVNARALALVRYILQGTAAQEPDWLREAKHKQALTVTAGELVAGDPAPAQDPTAEPTAPTNDPETDAAQTPAPAPAPAPTAPRFYDPNQLNNWADPAKQWVETTWPPSARGGAACPPPCDPDASEAEYGPYLLALTDPADVQWACGWLQNKPEVYGYWPWLWENPAYAAVGKTNGAPPPITQAIYNPKPKPW